MIKCLVQYREIRSGLFFSEDGVFRPVVANVGLNVGSFFFVFFVLFLFYRFLVFTLCWQHNISGVVCSALKKSRM